MMLYLLYCRFPIWFYHTPKFDFYGIPIYSNSGTKIGIDAGGPVVSANTRNFNPDPVREKICIDFLKKNIPRVSYLDSCLTLKVKTSKLAN